MRHVTDDGTVSDTGTIAIWRNRGAVSQGAYARQASGKGLDHRPVANCPTDRRGVRHLRIRPALRTP